MSEQKQINTSEIVSKLDNLLNKIDEFQYVLTYNKKEKENNLNIKNYG